MLVGCVLLFHRSHRARGEDRVHAEELEPEDVGAVVHFARREAMPAAVARKKGHAHAIDLADHVNVGRRAERRFDLALFENRQAFHVVEARASDDADLNVHMHSPRRESAPPLRRSRRARAAPARPLRDRRHRKRSDATGRERTRETPRSRRVAAPSSSPRNRTDE